MQKSKKKNNTKRRELHANCLTIAKKECARWQKWLKCAKKQKTKTRKTANTQVNNEENQQQEKMLVMMEKIRVNKPT